MLEFIQSADEAILAFLRDNVCVSKILDYIMIFFTYLGEEGIIWIIFGGVEIALLHAWFGVLCCITIIGIPFGKQHFKLAALALTPFGKRIVED